MKQDTQRNSTKSTLTPKQVQVIGSLASGATVTDAAKEADIGRTSVYLWMKTDDLFAAELNRSRQEYADAVNSQLRGLAAEAVKTVREMLTGADVSPAVRLKAALSVLQGAGALAVGTGPTDPALIEHQKVRNSWEQLRGLG